jgi:small neutral amino acid transporter SnatA (MarC family)
MCFISLTGDHQESSRRQVIIKNHRADGQLSTIFAPTGNYQQSSRRRAIIKHHPADGRL